MNNGANSGDCSVILDDNVTLNWLNFIYTPSVPEEEIIRKMVKNLGDLVTLNKSKESSRADKILEFINSKDFQKDWSDFCRLFDLQTNTWACSPVNIETAMILAIWNQIEFGISDEVLSFMEVMKRSISRLENTREEFTIDPKLIQFIKTGEKWSSYSPNPMLIITAMNELDISDVHVSVHEFFSLLGHWEPNIKKLYLEYLNKKLNLENKIVDYTICLGEDSFLHRMFIPIYEDLEWKKDFYTVWEVKYFLWEIGYFKNINNRNLRDDNW